MPTWSPWDCHAEQRGDDLKPSEEGRSLRCSMTTWETTDEPVLRWVAALPGPLVYHDIHEFNRSVPTPFDPIPGLDSGQVAAALLRLSSASLIGGRFDDLGSRLMCWNLYVAPRGLQVFGEWPDLNAVASAVGMRRLLLELADETSDPAEQGALKGAAGLVGRTTNEVIRDAIGELAADATKEVIE